MLQQKTKLLPSSFGGSRRRVVEAGFTVASSPSIKSRKWLLLTCYVLVVGQTTPFTFVSRNPFNFRFAANNFRCSLSNNDDVDTLKEKLTSLLNPSNKEALSEDQEGTSTLPIMDVIPSIQQSLMEKPNLLLEAPPGAGKTTMVPLACLALALNEQQNPTHEEAEKSGHKMVWVVEPRRVAARAAANRMANLLGESVGQTVGYAIRGESRISSTVTRIVVVTDGVLINRVRQDPELNGIHTILFDEFHERGVNSDTALALCRESQKVLRTDLKLAVMSATLLGTHFDSDNYQYSDDISSGDDVNTASNLVKTLGGRDECRVLQSEGRQFPVSILWPNQLDWKTTRHQPLAITMRDKNMLTETMSVAIEQGVKLAPASGDILAFLPGVAEIRRVMQALEERGELIKSSVEVVPLYGALPKDQQDYALFPSHGSSRRVIVSTPIAEASLTLKRVTCVVDSGLRREPRCDVDTGMPRLVTSRCSRASATQRAGRAGRVQEGICIRIYNEAEYDDQFLEHSPPEIKSTDLSPTLLFLADWGCASIQEILHDLPFVDPPNEDAVEKGLELLADLNAVERKDEENGDRFTITDQGRHIVRLPMHPRFAAACIVGSNNQPEQLGASVAAAFLLDDESSGANSGKGSRGNPDVTSRVRELYQGSGGRGEKRRALLSFAGRIGDRAIETVNDIFEGKIELISVLQSLGVAMLPGFVDLVAECKGDTSYGGSSYLLSLGRSARLDGTRDAPKYIVVLETSTGDDDITRIRSYVPIDKDSLLKHSQEIETVFTVPSKGHEVRAKKVTVVGRLELASMPLPSPSTEQVEKILKKTIRDLGGVYPALVANAPHETRRKIDDLVSRVKFAANQSGSGDGDWPSAFSILADYSDRGVNGGSEDKDEEDKILEELVEPWLAAAGSLKKIDVHLALSNILTPDQIRQLNDNFPVKIIAPDGSEIPVSYGTVPTASAKLQQFFGTLESPTVGPPNDRLPVTLSLLSPSGKILAQTSDLPFFWNEVYPSIRAEMRGRYAKHPWPENPTEAVATRQTKKQMVAASNSKAGSTPNTTSEKKGAEKPSKKKRGRKR